MRLTGEVRTFTMPTALLACLVATLIAIVGTPALAADDSPSLGISKSFRENGIIDMTPGQTLPPEQFIRVDNVGPKPAVVEWETTAPNGITITPEVTKATIGSDESLEIPFAITVAETTAGGDYPVGVNVKQTNVPPPKGGGIIIAPAVGANFVVRVNGASATAIIRGISAVDGSSLTGDLRLSQVNDKNLPVVISNTEGTELQTNVAPGKYRGTFTIPGLIEESVDFTLSDDETKTVDIPVTTVQFVVADALPQPGSGEIVSAKLVSSLKNNVQRLKGPLRLVAVVARDGVEIETVDIQSFPALPPGLTDASTTYVPASGWSAGEYTFEFQLRAAEYTVSAPAPKPIVVPGLSLIWPILGALAVVLFLLWWFLIRRRRDDDDDEVVPVPPPATPVSQQSGNPPTLAARPAAPPAWPVNPPAPSTPAPPPTTPQASPPPVGPPHGGMPPIAPPPSGPPQQPPPPTGPPHA